MFRVWVGVDVKHKDSRLKEIMLEKFLIEGSGDDPSTPLVTEQSTSFLDLKIHNECH